MKRIIIYCLFASFFELVLAQSNYQDIDLAEKTIIFSDTFNDNSNWPTRILKNIYEFKIENGYYSLIISNPKSGNSVTKTCTFSDTLNFEFETYFKVEGGHKQALNVFFIRTSTGSYYFGENGLGEYVIFADNGNQFIIPFTQSDLLKKSDFNKYTVRKSGSKLFFFLNEKLIHEMSYIPITSFGFSIASSSTIIVDYINVMKIGEKIRL